MSERLNTSQQHGTSWQLHQARYKFASRYIFSKRVLDVACGIGYGSKILADSGAEYVIGVDINKSAIATARQNYYHPSINFVVSSGTRLPLDNATIDIVVSFETIEHINQPSIFIQEIHRVLKPGGILIISTPNKKITSPISWLKPYNRFHISELTQKEFKNLLEKKFTNLNWFGQQSIQSQNLPKFQRIQTWFQITRLMPNGFVQLVKKSIPYFKKYHQKYISDSHSAYNPQTIEVQPASEIPFSRYMIVVAKKTNETN